MMGQLQRRVEQISRGSDDGAAGAVDLHRDFISSLVSIVSRLSSDFFAGWNTQQLFQVYQFLLHTA
jgi:hypothetical protein